MKSFLSATIRIRTFFVLFLISLTILLATVLLTTTLRSFSYQEDTLRNTSDFDVPTVVLLPTQSTLQHDTNEETPNLVEQQPLTAKEYEAVLTKFDNAYCDSSACMDGYSTVHDLIELQGQLYFFASEIRSDGSEQTGLAVYDLQAETSSWLIDPTSDLVFEALQEQSGALFFMVWSQPETRTLVKYASPNPGLIPLYTGDFRTYQVYGDTVFFQSENNLLALPLDGADTPVCLWKNSERIELRSFCATQAGVVVSLAPANWKEGLIRLYLLFPEGGHSLLFDGTGEISYLSSSGDTIFFLYREKVNTSMEQRLVSVSCQDPTPVFIELPRKRSTHSAYLSSFFVSGNNLIFCYRRFDSDCLELYVTDLQGNVLEQYVYDNSRGKLLLDTMTVKATLGRSYLFLQGKSYFNGTKTTTRIERSIISDCTQEAYVATPTTSPS